MSTSKNLDELATLIHNMIEIQGPHIMYGQEHVSLGCYHPGPGLGQCEGIARAILNKYKIERL